MSISTSIWQMMMKWVQRGKTNSPNCTPSELEFRTRSVWPQRQWPWPFKHIYMSPTSWKPQGKLSLWSYYIISRVLITMSTWEGNSNNKTGFLFTGVVFWVGTNPESSTHRLYCVVPSAKKLLQYMQKAEVLTLTLMMLYWARCNVIFAVTSWQGAFQCISIGNP